jgi:hypothetical protein
LSQKAREIIGAIDGGKMGVEEGLKELDRWRQQRRQERLREEARVRRRPARWLRVKVLDPRHGRRFNLWLPMIIIFWALSLGFWGLSLFRWFGRRTAERWRVPRSSGLEPTDYRGALAGLRIGLVACGKIVDVQDDDGTCVEVWLG